MNKNLFLLFILFLLFPILPNNYCFAAPNFDFLLRSAYDFPHYLLYFIQFLMLLGIILSVITLAMGGIQIIFSSVSPEKKSEAKKRVTSAVFGLVILLSSFLIIQTINPDIKNLKYTEDTISTSPFRLVGGSDGGFSNGSRGLHSGCEIDECLGLDGSCSWNNCGGMEHGNCPPEKGCPNPNPSSNQNNNNEEEDCSTEYCISTKSGCGWNECLGLDKSCSGGNCNWAIYKNAPPFLENTDTIIGRYPKIIWKSSFPNLSGNLIKGCDENSNLIYNIYLYRDYNFKDLYNIIRLRCNDWREDIGQAKSYTIIKEVPGVYFYGNSNCYPSGDSPVLASTESIPQGSDQEIKSIRIVNGPDRINGPFFGLIYFNDYDYKTNPSNPLAMEIQQKIWKSPDWEAWDNYSYCFNLENSKKNGSWVIYKRVGFEEDGETLASAGNGITIYSKTGWLGGSKQLSEKSRTSANLKNTPVFYSSNSNVPKEEQELCPYFYPEKYCLKSFEIKGDYLVVVSSGLFRGNNHPHKPDFFSVHAQAFPISSRLKVNYKNKENYSVQKGTPEIMLDYIGWLKKINFIEVIPLAEK